MCNTSDLKTVSPQPPTVERRVDVEAVDRSGTQPELRPSIAAALAAFRQGAPVIIVGGEGQENRGHIAVPADAVDSDGVAFMRRHSGGILGVAMPDDRADELGLALMVEADRDAHSLSPTVTVDSRLCTSRGVARSDLALTIGALADATTQPDDLVRPGQVGPLRVSNAGTLHRARGTEAAVDLARLAGRSPVVALVEIANIDGSAAETKDVVQFGEQHNLPILPVSDLVLHRLATQSVVERVATTKLSTQYGELEAITYRSALDMDEHVAFVMGTPAQHPETLVRVSVECAARNFLGSLICDCSNRIDEALEEMSRHGHGVVVHVGGRNSSLCESAAARNDQNEVLRCGSINARQGANAAQILKDLGLSRVRLTSDGSAINDAVSGFGLEIMAADELADATR